MIELIFSPHVPTPSPTPIITHIPNVAPPTNHGDEAMSHHLWNYGQNNNPNNKYDKCDDGTNGVTTYKAYYVVSYDGKNTQLGTPPQQSLIL